MDLVSWDKIFGLEILKNQNFKCCAFNLTIRASLAPRNTLFLNKVKYTNKKIQIRLEESFSSSFSKKLFYAKIQWKLLQPKNASQCAVNPLKLLSKVFTFSSVVERKQVINTFISDYLKTKHFHSVKKKFSWQRYFYNNNDVTTRCCLNSGEIWK